MWNCGDQIHSFSEDLIRKYRYASIGNMGPIKRIVEPAAGLSSLGQSSWRANLDLKRFLGSQAISRMTSADIDLFGIALDIEQDAENPLFGDAFTYKGRRDMPPMSLACEKLQSSLNSGPSNNGYMFFSPSYYIRKGFLKQSDLDMLRDGGRMLTVGSGAAHLEKFISSQSVAKSQIHLSDLETGLIVNQGFEVSRFNMWKQWPQFRNKFDLIIFPESIFHDEIDFQTDANRAMKHDSDGGQNIDFLNRMGIYQLEESGKNYLFEAEAKYYYDNLFKKALDNLNQSGEIRATYFHTPEHWITYLKEIAESDGKKLEVDCENGSVLITYLA